MKSKKKKTIEQETKHLWVEKYKPKTFVDLLGDQVNNNNNNNKNQYTQYFVYEHIYFNLLTFFFSYYVNM